jgi:malate dehydrogenase
MREVAIIGAGELGGALAHALARRDLARTITLVDEHGHVAEGKALDISQAAPVEGFATQLAGSTDLAAGLGAPVVVIADRFGGGEWQGDEASLLLQQYARARSKPVIVCAGATHLDLIERGLRDLRLPRDRFFGSAPEALCAGARTLVALALDGSALDVSLLVIGRPPAHTVVAWEDGSFCGAPLTGAIDDPTRRRIAARIAALWPPGPQALAAAAATVIAAMSTRSRQRVTCFVGPDDAPGVRARTGAWPVKMGRSGIVDVLAPLLSVADRIALENALRL